MAKNESKEYLMKKNNSNNVLPKKENLQNFEVPEGYFKQNAINLKQIAKKAPAKEIKVFRLKPIVSWLSAAAVVTLIIFGVVNRETTSAPSALSDDELYALMEVGYVSFNDYNLADLDLTDESWIDIDAETAEEYLENSDLYYLEESLIYESY